LSAITLSPYLFVEQDPFFMGAKLKLCQKNRNYFHVKTAAGKKILTGTLPGNAP
jgi:hypothetical protein